MNICLMGVPKGEEREKGAENLLKETMAGNFSNLEKDTNIQVEEALRVPCRMNSKKSTLRHIKIKMSKVKDEDRILEEAQEKQLFAFKGMPINYQLIFQPKPCRLEGSGMKYYKCLKEKLVTKNTQFNKVVIHN